tara:strand:+ start:10522 stop:10731 length:210 start_codon:yes stop_codon:yes gene_type:complete
MNPPQLLPSDTVGIVEQSIVPQPELQPQLSMVGGVNLHPSVIIGKGHGGEGGQLSGHVVSILQGDSHDL